MKIHIFAERFMNGSWDFWEHACGPQEADALVDYAIAIALGRTPIKRPTHNDFLESARRMFNVSAGEPGFSRNGDTRVYCVCVDGIVIGVYEKVRKYSQRIAEAHQLAFEKSA
jgi:hypothetical protein